MPEIKTHSGKAAMAYLGDLACLRIAVFREFPYLYEGSLEYEKGYLVDYFSSKKSLLVTVWDGHEIIGASTALPLAEADPEFQVPFLKQSMEPTGIFYFGESVLLPEYRGQGLGSRFFDIRESWAKSCGMRTTAFCAVHRELDHPCRPAGYSPLNAFWKRLGYVRQDGLIVKLAWQEVGSNRGEETDHSLAIWVKDLE